MIDQLQNLFLEVADLDEKQRSQYFDRHGISPELREEVEELLRFDQGSANLLTGVVGATVEQFLDSQIDRFCGPYELVRLLGRGGMGSVHLAQRKDGEVDLQVAVKLIRGAAATPVFLDRFLGERQILASLKHPGITRLLDAGHTKSGQPYFVMEYVDGTPIDVYCEKLPVAAKLKLFLLVCDAIAYLHRNLVIHRDLKPSNILVEANGSPKLLDFGIAKILDKSADGNVTQERILTPNYASPEQVKGTAKTTATDVYSLGAILYELLAGRSPHATESGASVDEVITSVAPVPLLRLNRSLPRDLGIVVHKALRKEPSERYPTVDAFADDLRAVLESRPVRARSGDAWYRTRKFARRHWLPVSAVAASILSLAAGLYVASRQKTVAQQRFAQLRQLSNRVLALDGDIRNLPGATQAREKIAAVSIEYLDGLGRESRNDIDLKLEVANGYRSTAEVQGVPITSNLGKFDQAEASLAKAAGLVESVLTTAPVRADALLLGAQIETDRMIIADTQHDRPRELAHADRTAGYLDRFAKAHPTVEQRRQAARVLLSLGQGWMNMRRYQEAVPQIEQAVGLARTSGAPPAMVAQGLSLLANARRQAGDLEGAFSAITEARALTEKLPFENETARMSTLYAVFWRQGLILGEDESVSLNRPADAIEAFQKAYDVVDQFASKDPNEVGSRDRLGTAGLQLGDVLRHTEPVRALAIYDHTLLRLREVKTSANMRRQEALVLAHSSYPLRSLHRLPEAKQRIDAAFEILRQLGQEAGVGIIGGEWDNTMRASADNEAETGHPERARSIFLDLQTNLLASHPNPETDLRHANDMSRLWASLAALDAKLGNIDEQKMFEAKRADLWRQWNQRLPNNSFVRRQMEIAQ